MPSSRHATHESLLIRMRNYRDAAAWERFYQTYSRLIISYVRRKGGSEQIAQDVLQETLITLAKTMQTFQYDRFRGRFRYFLLTIVRSRMIDAYRRESKQDTIRIADAAQSGGHKDVSSETSYDNWDDEWEREWERTLLVAALRRIRDKVKPHIYESFRLYVLESRPAGEVSSVLNIPRSNIYEHRRRLIAMLREEVQTLREELGE